MADLRLAVRNLLRSPGFAATAVATLALGIGATTTIFSVLYGVLLRPLPYPDPDSLVVIEAEVDFPSGARAMNFSATEIENVETETHPFSSVGAVDYSATALKTDEGTENVRTALVSKGVFATLGRPMLLGRGLEDDHEPVVVISHGLWQRVFGGAADIVGRGITLSNRQGLNARVFTIVGVAPPDFRFPDARTDVWRPVGFDRAIDEGQINNRRAGGFWFVGRLKPGATIADATRDVGAVIDRLRPTLNEVRRASRPKIERLGDRDTGTIGPVLIVLLSAVLFVLLIACVNVANLILARQSSRAREIAVRIALGAPRGQLIRQLLSEALVVAMAGGGLGVAMAGGGVAVLQYLQPAQIPRLESVHVDGPVLGFVLVVAILTAVVSGLIPAVVTTRTDTALAILGRTRADPGSIGARRLRSALVVFEIAASIILMVGATLLARSLTAMLNADLGVTRDHLLAADLDVSVGRQLAGPRQVAIAEELEARIAALPGVRAVGFGTGLPPAGEFVRVSFELNNAANPGGRSHMVTLVPASAGFFSTLEVPLVRGRVFSDTDNDAGEAVAIINREAARRFFGDADPIGLTLPVRPNDQRERGVKVVGVVGNVKFTGVAKPDEATIYLPFAQIPSRHIFLVVRTLKAPEVLAGDVRQIVRSYDKDINIAKLQALDDWVSDSVIEPRFRALLLSSIACIAVVLAAIGLYGVIAYSVSQRVPEIGIRMALGAQARDVNLLVVGEGARLALTGTALGLAGAYAIRRTLASFLFGVGPSDPISFGTAAAGLLMVALLASYLPARRAARVDPAVALRAD